MPTSPTASRLRAAGFGPRLLAAWCGTDHLPAIRVPPPSATPIGRLFDLFVAGRVVPNVAAAACELVEHPTPDTMRATVAVLPLGDGFVVADRRDAADEPARVEWPDDSSYHLAKSIPAGPYARWLDLGCGSAVAQLLRPQLAGERVALDVNPRAVRYARLGAALSGVAIDARAGDFAAAPADCDLVTCNPPLPAAAARAIWRAGPADIVDRALAAARRTTGLAVVHAALPDVAGGDVTIVRYAAPLGVLWWRPHAPARRAIAERVLTPERPHVDAHDLIASRP